MFAQILKRSLTLLVMYAVLIIGIFVAQFKNDSIISEKFGTLHISLLESISDDNTSTLKNKFSIFFNGLNFSASEEKPLIAKINSKERNVTLLSWERLSPLSCQLNFSYNIKLRFSVSDESPRATLSIESEMPQSVASVSVPFGLSAGAAIVSQSDSKLQISNRKTDWEFSAGDIDGGHIIFTPREHFASYAYYDKSRLFSFDMIAGLSAASETSFNTVVEGLKTNLITAFSQIPADSMAVGEQEAVSFVAAMAERGRYNEALDMVPSPFKKSSARTFLSAPYFDTLVKVTAPMQIQLRAFSDLIASALETRSLDVFSVKYIADYMCMNPQAQSVRALLSLAAAADESTLSVQNAVALLSVYDELVVKNPALAALLQPVALACAKKIETLCNLDDSVLTLAENGAFLSVVQAVAAGDALYRYGRIVDNADFASGGRMIVVSYLKDSASFDVRTLGELYPLVVHGNSFYPHFEVISFAGNRSVWAWTIARKISYVNDNAGTVTLTVDFPLSYTHYIIVNGIEPFRSIYIYDMAFRTDPRFETYNSSGYVYQKDTGTLLLKSRHKSQLEDIRLIYTQEAQKKTEEIVGGEEQGDGLASAAEPASRAPASSGSFSVADAASASAD